MWSKFDNVTPALVKTRNNHLLNQKLKLINHSIRHHYQILLADLLLNTGSVLAIFFGFKILPSGPW